MLIDILALLLSVIGLAGLAYRHFENRRNQADIADLNTTVDELTLARDKAEDDADQNLEGWRRSDKYCDDLARQYETVLRERNDLDAIARDMADKLAALTAHEALVIDREELPAWDYVTAGGRRVPVGPPSVDFTREFCLPRDENGELCLPEDAEQMALTGGNV